MKTVAFIPVRGGSKGIIGKNIKMMIDKPLVMWSAEAAAGCELIDEVIVATDSKPIAKCVIEWRSTDKIKVLTVQRMDDDCLQETPMSFFEHYETDTIVLLQATTPQTTSEDLTGGIKEYLKGHDSLVSVCRQHKFIWSKGGLSNYYPEARPRRQDWNGLLIENGGFFITSRKRFLQSRCRISGKIGTYEMPSDTYWEIDEPVDWDIVETLLKRRLQ